MAKLHRLPRRIIDAHNHISADDPDGSQMLANMDENNIELALIMSTSMRPHATTANVLAKHPTRFIGGGYADPRQGKKAIAAIKAYHADGLRMVKLFPNLGYFPDDDAYRPFFDTVASLKMAVLSHCGWLTPKSGITAAYYAQPGRFEKLIRTYTQTPFVLAHMGGMDGFLQMIMLITRNRNVYADCSPGQGTWVLDHAGEMVSSVPADRLMWGADSYQQKHFLDHNRKALIKIGFGGDLEKIFYSNARSLFEGIGAISPKA